MEEGKFTGRIQNQYRNPAVDAAFQIAMDVLDKAKSPQYAFEGEHGMWSAGAFQGTGMGFGVWCRDTMQMLLRGMVSLILK